MQPSWGAVGRSQARWSLDQRRSSPGANLAWSINKRCAPFPRGLTIEPMKSLKSTRLAAGVDGDAVGIPVPLLSQVDNGRGKKFAGGVTVSLCGARLKLGPQLIEDGAEDAQGGGVKASVGKRGRPMV